MMDIHNQRKYIMSVLAQNRCHILITVLFPNTRTGMNLRSIIPVESG
jgi:hypothetical protein